MSSPDRQAINEHMHRHHGGAALSGTTLSRLVLHDLAHADAERGVAGNPQHFHQNADAPVVSEALAPTFLEDQE